METLKLIINCFNTSLLLSSRISTNLAGNQPVTKIPEIIYVKLTVRQIEVKWLIQMAAVGVNTREEKSTDLWGHWALQPNSVHPSVRWSEKWRLKKITMGYKLEARCVVCVCVCVRVCPCSEATGGKAVPCLLWLTVMMSFFLKPSSSSSCRSKSSKAFARLRLLRDTTRKFSWSRWWLSIE